MRNLTSIAAAAAAAAALSASPAEAQLLPGLNLTGSASNSTQRVVNFSAEGLSTQVINTNIVRPQTICLGCAPLPPGTPSFERTTNNQNIRSTFGLTVQQVDLGQASAVYSMAQPCSICIPRSLVLPSISGVTLGTVNLPNLPTFGRVLTP